MLKSTKFFFLTVILKILDYITRLGTVIDDSILTGKYLESTAKTLKELTHF